MTRNEEASIGKCLRSLQGMGEIFVVDSGSMDRTAAIAEEHNASVIQFEWNGRYPKKKQWSLENLPFSYNWVLYVDADEEVTAELRLELEQVFASGTRADGYSVELDYCFLGRTLRHGLRVSKLVLFDRRRGRFEECDDLDATNMWEVEGHYQPRIEGSVATLRSRLIHEDHDSLFHYFERHNRYSDWEAVLQRKGHSSLGASSNPGDEPGLKRVFRSLPFKPVVFFFYSYVVKRGFLDGRAGYHYAVAKAFYYWQIRVKELELAGARE
jgi:glycosyltransferase involved in cell wall biosynthesis